MFRIALPIPARPARTARTDAIAGNRSRREALLFLALITPNLLLLTVFTYWPMIYNVYLSSVRWDMIAPAKQFIGLDNFRYLAQDQTFREVLVNTFYFTAGAVGGTLVLGLAAALLLNQPLRGRNGARAVLFAPYLLSGAAISIVWYYMFDHRFGALAQILGFFGLNSPTWMTDPTWSMPAIIIVYVWKSVGFSTVIFLAGLQSIPAELYEAARVDGAGRLRRFWSITLPMLSPISFFVVLTSILLSFQAFDIIAVMTQGGPVNSTNTLIYYVYEQAFVRSNAGRSAAGALVLFVIMLAITLFQLRFNERRVHYG
jgi:sn-glycerol 3-phosphate transport system permease protein